MHRSDGRLLDRRNVIVPDTEACRDDDKYHEGRHSEFFHGDKNDSRSLKSKTLPSCEARNTYVPFNERTKRAIFQALSAITWP
jgi:hypothetical protein